MIMTIPLTRFMPQFLSPMLRASASSPSAPSPTSFTLLESWYALLNMVNFTIWWIYLEGLETQFCPQIALHILPSLAIVASLLRPRTRFPILPCNPSCCLNIMLPPTRVAKRLSTIFLGAPATCECAPGGEELQLPHSCPKVASDPPATQELTATTLHPFKAMIPGPRYHPRPVFTSCNRLHYNLPAIDFIIIFQQ